MDSLSYRYPESEKNALTDLWSRTDETMWLSSAAVVAENNTFGYNDGFD